jgi:two-component system, NarL family, response regulator DevR
MNAPDSKGPVRVLMIDDSSIIRLGLRAALEDRRDITIVGEAGTAAAGVAAAEALKPDVILLDLRLPDQTGLDACRAILRKQPGARVLFLTSSTDERNVHEAIAAGAKGYLLKESDSEALASAIIRVAAGNSVLDPTLTNHVLNLMKNPPSQRPAGKLALLSAQERRVLALLAEGLTNKEIGLRLNLTEKTVKNYLSTVFDKLGVTRRTQAAALYMQSATGRS